MTHAIVKTFLCSSKIRCVLYRQWKCSICQKVLNNKIQLKLHSKIHPNNWNVSSMGSDNSQKELTSTNSNLSSITTLDVRVDPDSSVSERVLLDTVAEKKIMEYTDVSIEIYANLFILFMLSSI